MIHKYLFRKLSLLFVAAICVSVVNPHFLRAECAGEKALDTRKTSSNFETYWVAFQKAVKNSDTPALFGLVDACQFEWEGAELNWQRRPDHYFMFRSEKEFAEKYPQIFNDEIKNKILTAKPVRETWEWKGKPYHRYAIEWSDPYGSKSLNFSYIEAIGYKFSSFLVGPPDGVEELSNGRHQEDKSMPSQYFVSVEKAVGEYFKNHSTAVGWTLSVNSEEEIISTNWYSVHKGEVRLRTEIRVSDSMFRVDSVQKVGFVFPKVEKTEQSRKEEWALQRAILKSQRP